MNTDNRQGTPSEAEIAWVAGIIEGEGTLMLSAHRRNERQSTIPGNPKVTAYVVLYNTDGGIIRKFVEILNRMGINPHIGEREQKPMMRPGGGEYRPTATMLRASIKSMGATHKLLTAIRPWLFGDKSARADLMLQFLESRFKRSAEETKGVATPYDQGELGIVDRFYRLTRKGRSGALDGLLNEQEQCAPL